jgi:hypothetical protein
MISVVRWHLMPLARRAAFIDPLQDRAHYRDDPFGSFATGPSQR